MRWSAFAASTVGISFGSKEKPTRKIDNKFDSNEYSIENILEIEKKMNNFFGIFSYIFSNFLNFQ